MAQGENREGNVPAYQTASSSISSHTHTRTHTRTHAHTKSGNKGLSNFSHKVATNQEHQLLSLQPGSHYTHNLYRAAAAINPNQPQGSNFCYCRRSFCTVRKARLRRPHVCACVRARWSPASGSIRRLSEQVLNTSQPRKLSIVSLDNNCIPWVISYRADNRSLTGKTE